MQVHFVLVLGLTLQVAFRVVQTEDECTSLVNRFDQVNPSMSNPPYEVSSDVLQYKDGQVITVTLQANNAVFSGFFLEAWDEIGPVGTFRVTGDDAKLLNCGSEGSAVSNASQAEKSIVVVQWSAPVSNNRDFRFRATVLQDFSHLWVGVESYPVKYLPNLLPNLRIQTTKFDTAGSLPPELSFLLFKELSLPTISGSVSKPSPTASTPSPSASTPSPSASTPSPSASTPSPSASTSSPSASTSSPSASTSSPSAFPSTPSASTPSPAASTATSTAFTPTPTASMFSSTISTPNETLPTANITNSPPISTTTDSSSSSTSLPFYLLLLPLLATI
ncbi:hypothetical protein DNTS_004117 [Danionella cerebrum]|uniref:Reelin domain-containing protein n=1 Tax=Danionella cerebrum TaxID=2873325 RepID=A0A553MUJ6_9TELE|nr:hypothetical protein DNTS_004117 [Danionella translucida]TRY56853.1 hypothetical protein DNTS_004117 [Danionella translucida]